MGKRKAAGAEESTCDPNAPRPRLKRLVIRNFRAIGSSPVEIELDDIVVLVGPNNVGKSSILRAYEVVMQHGSKQGKLTAFDFPNGDTNSDEKPEIIIETVVFDAKAPGEQWIIRDPLNGEMSVKEKWTYAAPGADPKKVGWDVAQNEWHETSGPWGTANVAQAARPEPHRIEAFARPETQAEEIIKLLTTALTGRIDTLRATERSNDGEKSKFQALQESLINIQKEIATEAQAEIDNVQNELSNIVGAVFPGHQVVFDPKIETEPKVNFFGTSPELRMGPEGGFQPAVEHQGSGARRTLLWAAIRILSEQKRTQEGKNQGRPHVLLIDEPELCLHPNAVRDARDVLYDLPSTGNWQVMVTTHSPVFIDLSRDNTSIIRVEKTSAGEVQGTNLFRPKRVQLDDDDRARLKLLNLFDPYVAEFFFGGRVIIVEGDTEYTALKHVIATAKDEYADIHIIRARGKGTIVSMCKILNQFGTPYVVLHDCDVPTVKVKKTDKEQTNGSWTLNQKIRDVMADAINQGRARLIASVTNFELAYFGEEVASEKPYNALEKMTASDDTFRTVAQLLKALTDRKESLPKGAMEWNSLTDLEVAVASMAAPAP